jgi:alkylhydroperoxidase family enzyme
LNGIASLAMNSPLVHPPPRQRESALTYVEPKTVELLAILLADIADDVGIAARDLGISDASLVRCRRAMDRVPCAQSVLETMRAAGMATETWAVVWAAAITRAAVEATGVRIER